MSIRINFIPSKISIQQFYKSGYLRLIGIIGSLILVGFLLFFYTNIGNWNVLFPAAIVVIFQQIVHFFSFYTIVEVDDVELTLTKGFVLFTRSSSIPLYKVVNIYIKVDKQQQTYLYYQLKHGIIQKIKLAKANEHSTEIEQLNRYLKQHIVLQLIQGQKALTAKNTAATRPS